MPKIAAPARDAAEPFRFAIVTPSYYVDVEHCRFLVDTVERYVPQHVQHYLVVDRADRALFAPLASARTHVIIKEDVLQGRLWQVPFARRWWLGARSLPIRGWIVQQLTKLFIHEVAPEDVFIFVDSGAFFVRPYDPSLSIRDGRVPLFRESGDYFKSKVAYRWHAIGADLFGIRPMADYDVGYVKTLVTWRRDNLIKMHEHIERVLGRPSFDALTRQVTLSEYYLYGMYSDLILGDRSGHYHTPVIETRSHWSERPLTVDELRALRRKVLPEEVLVMINEKSRTSVEDVRLAFSGE